MDGRGRNLLFGALAVLGALALLEAAARLALPAPERADPAAGYDYTLGMLRPAGARWEEAAYVGVAGREISTAYALNALRLRGPEAAREKPAGALRVLALGDSSTFGLGVAEGRTYPRALEGLLSAPEGRTVQVLNAGVPGFSSAQGYVRLREELLALAPDVAIVSFGLNDASTTTLQLQDDRKTHYADAFLLRRWLVVGGLARPDWLAGLGIVRGLDAAMAALRPALGGEGEGEPRVAPAAYRRFLEEIAGAVRGRGGAVLFLNIGAPPPYRALLEETAARLGAPYVDGTAEMVRRAEEARTAQPYREILDELGAAWGVDWDRVDRSERLVLWDSIHPNAVGCRFLAEALAERAAPMLAERAP